LTVGQIMILADYVIAYFENFPVAQKRE